MSLIMKVISKVEIEPITEEFIGQLIRKEIAAQNPDVNVNKIEFKVSRNPTRVEAIVDAQYGAIANTVTEPEKTSASVLGESKDEPAVTNSLLDTPDDEAVTEASEAADGNAKVADIFTI